ncbi:heme ABC transporter ATP-binding protein [Phyllobacterium brassicacearum]|uniref:Heme ABC transporter ATP-binding protein n=1 Tax=Phyllobacterium brassicacearum TaxID=314235 RepID=A0A2P7BD61_9HYPH|nr:heme ABC transporter ATP-binding protein [Phyllobacterium brassicacearum]PSH64396.1 heme ABC transporter ATP-binding protein [Phyllobacterium brassicacearum]TDQ21266.1 iron complex transport system ATP-binding protein [Phyllobacterium brassicacearum]
MIEVTDVSVHLGKTQIIDNASFTARAGEVTIIVGPNGSGKTTLMRALSGDLPFTGKIAINGRSMGKLRLWEMAAMRAILPQSTSLSFPFTVREIVKLGLTSGRSGATRREVEMLPDEALQMVDLAGFGGRFYQELSGGEQQRVQLARVLCQVWQPVLDGEPRFLFLDEPVSSLDIKHQLIIMQTARSFADRGGGVIAILHDLNLTSMYADRVVVMHRGHTDCVGTPSEVLTDERILRVYDCALKVGALPAEHVPFVLPQSVAI